MQLITCPIHHPTKSSMRSTFLILLSLFTQSLFAQTTADSLTNELTTFFETSSLNGLGVAIVKPEGIIYSRGLGYANIEEKSPYTTQTVQPIGSVSKTLLAVALMKAQELGFITLDDEVNQYLPFELINPHFPDQTITFRHLASHTAGVNDTKHYDKAYLFTSPITLQKGKEIKKLSKTYNSNKAMPLEQFLSNIYSEDGEWYSKSNFLKKKPSEHYNYSNNGSAIASMALAKAVSMSYKDFVKKHILDPLEMNQSSWVLADYEKEEKATLYYNSEEIPDFELITYADGGFVTSVEDFSKYFSAIMRGFKGKESTLLSKKSFDEMFTIQFENEESIGIFWISGGKRIGHTGGDPGVITITFFKRDDPIGLVLFTNNSPTKEATSEMSTVFRMLDNYSSRLD